MCILQTIGRGGQFTDSAAVVSNDNKCVLFKKFIGQIGDLAGRAMTSGRIAPGVPTSFVRRIRTKGKRATKWEHAKRHSSHPKTGRGPVAVIVSGS